MKKRLIFGLTALAFTALGVTARLWQRNTAFEPETGLLTPGMPATVCVMAVVLAAAVGVFLLSRWAARGVAFESYLTAFSLPHPAALALYVLAGALLVAAGVVGILDYRSAAEKSVPWLILSVALIPTGAGVGLVGWLGGQREEGKGRFAWPLLLPGYCACGWAVLVYEARTIGASVMGYVFILFGAACAAIFCYAVASFSFERPRTGGALWLGVMSAVLLAMACVDLALEGDRMCLLMALGMGIYALSQTACLIWRCEVPAPLTRWTPPETEKTEETEVKDHEQ